MGSYGVTHIKKDNTVFPLSDSYDGYVSAGMGQSNMLCIKYLSTPILKRLFDEYTATKKVKVNKLSEFSSNDRDDVSLSKRQIDDAIFHAMEDTQSKEVEDWMTTCLSGDIRTSICGFAPLMYLNVNPHYGRNYDYCDYMVDLDNEIFMIYDNIKIPFNKIRAMSENQLDAFCSNNVDVLKKEEQKIAEDFLDSDFEGKTDAEIKYLTNKVLDMYINVSNGVIDSFLHEKEEERKTWLAEQNNKIFKDNEKYGIDEEDYGGFSLKSTNTNGVNVRNFTTLVQKISKVKGCEFLTTHCEWGVNENYSEGGLRIFSPKSSRQYNVYEMFCDAVESEFKLRFNIFSSSGTWSVGEVADSSKDEYEDEFGLFSDKIKGPEKSLFTLEDIKSNYDKNTSDIIINEVHPYLTIHGQYEEVREVILKSEKISTPILWVYISLLNQDKDVFAKVYPMAKELIETLDKSTRTGALTKYLCSLADGNTINNIVVNIANEIGQDIQFAKFSDFTNYLKDAGFFKDVESVMTKEEKKKYLNNDVKTVRKKM